MCLYKYSIQQSGSSKKQEEQKIDKINTTYLFLIIYENIIFAKLGQKCKKCPNY